jgi:demethylmenaquinone methyltransferase/2-methoxy-6-polyprenyl-1,4-benzoquinol methylase
VGTNVVPDINSALSKKQQVEGMFDDIAKNYDFLNRLLSFRIDVLWRKKVIKMLKPYQPKHILDLATGTADLAIELVNLKPTQIIGGDLSAQMLAVGQTKIEAKKLTDNQFDAITIAFGVRNFENLSKGLAEMNRVLKPGGQLFILEFSKVKTFPIKQFYNFYFRYITPTIGKLFSKSNQAYSYLPNSVAVFPEGEEMCVILQESGFKNTLCKPVSFGIASIYQAEK